MLCSKHVHVTVNIFSIEFITFPLSTKSRQQPVTKPNYFSFTSCWYCDHPTNLQLQLNLLCFTCGHFDFITLNSFHRLLRYRVHNSYYLGQIHAVLLPLARLSFSFVIVQWRPPFIFATAGHWLFFRPESREIALLTRSTRSQQYVREDLLV